MKTTALLFAAAMLTLAPFGCVEEKRTEKVFIGGEPITDTSTPLYEEETVNE